MLYTSLHSTYSLLWLYKFSVFPDYSFEQPIDPPMNVYTFVLVLTLWYCVAPVLMIADTSMGDPESWRVLAAVACYGVGLMEHA